MNVINNLKIQLFDNVFSDFLLSVGVGFFFENTPIETPHTDYEKQRETEKNSKPLSSGTMNFHILLLPCNCNFSCCFTSSFPTKLF